MHGPSLVEVVLGAVLSLALGIVLGALLLVLKPVVTPKTEKDMPKEPAPGIVYYQEGTHDTAKAKQALAKRKAFASGQTVTVNEDELNSLVTPAPAAPPAPKPGEKAKPADKAAPAAPAANAGDMLATGTPNFRIRDGVLQIGIPVTVNALGLGQKVIVQARGGFEKKGDAFAFAPDALYFGSCPVQRLPFLSNYVTKKVLATQQIPEDIAAAWPKLANVSIEGNTLKLQMQ